MSNPDPWTHADNAHDACRCLACQCEARMLGALAQQLKDAMDRECAAILGGAGMLGAVGPSGCPEGAPGPEGEAGMALVPCPATHGAGECPLCKGTGYLEEAK